jgi:hypothetical protein
VPWLLFTEVSAFSRQESWTSSDKQFEADETLIQSWASLKRF